MICPRCHAEYRPGFTRCADCDVALVDDLEGAALEAEDGDGGSDRGGVVPGGPGGLEPLAELGDPEILGELLAQLEEAQIPYVVHAGTALALAHGKELESEGFPDPWKAQVMVVGSFKTQARELVSAIVEEAKRQALAARLGTAASPLS